VHLVTLFLLVITTDSLIDFSTPMTAIYWIIVLLSTFSYFNAAYRNPGFVCNYDFAAKAKSVDKEGTSTH
jgi:hypothetical protein